MEFDTSKSDVFEIDGSIFNFNSERTEYLADDIHSNYEKRIKKLGKNLKTTSKKKKHKVCGDIYALYSEWNVENNDETLYLLFSEDNEDVFTDVTTENEHYANLIEKDL